MNLRRLIIIAVSVGAVVAVVATVSVDILLQWSRSVSVVDVPKEQLVGLTDAQLSDKIMSGVFPMRSVKGAEKAAYLITYDRMTLVQSWLHYFVSCGIAAFLGGLLFNSRRRSLTK